jgi:hypothetical protein
VERCAKDSVYSIEYSSFGGFTGMNTGLTINCSGHVTFWEKMPSADSRTVKDSLELSDEQIDTFNKLIKNEELLDYKSDYTGNYTTTLLININERTNKISFNKSEPQKDFPVSVKNLIDEINRMHK